MKKRWPHTPFAPAHSRRYRAGAGMRVYAVQANKARIMTNFMRIFDVFSKRPEALAKPTHDIPQSTRNRVLLWCRELYSNSRSDLGDLLPEN
jgi:hypothetical protein